MKSSTELFSCSVQQEWEKLLKELEQLRNMAAAEEMRLTAEELEEDISTWKKKSWNIGVFGEQGVGKSTLINAMFGREVLETDADREPVAGAVCRWCEYDLRCPDKTDIALLVLTPDTFTERVFRFAADQLLWSGVRRILFVLNRADCLRGEDLRRRMAETLRAEVKEKVLGYIKKSYGIDSWEERTAVKKLDGIRVILLSAYDALDAREEGDRKLEEKSGILLLERELMRIFNEEQERIRRRIAQAEVQISVNRGRQRELWAMEREEAAQWKRETDAVLEDWRQKETENIRSITERLGHELEEKIREFSAELQGQFTELASECSDYLRRNHWGYSSVISVCSGVSPKEYLEICEQNAVFSLESFERRMDAWLEETVREECTRIGAAARIVCGSRRLPGRVSVTLSAGNSEVLPEQPRLLDRLRIKLFLVEAFKMRVRILMSRCGVRISPDLPARIMEEAAEEVLQELREGWWSAERIDTIRSALADTVEKETERLCNIVKTAGRC